MTSFAFTDEQWPLESDLRRHLLCFRQACRLSTPSSERKMVSAAGVAPAIPRSQAEDVAATPRAGNPRGTYTSDRGYEEHEGPNLGTVPRGENRKVADPKGLAPSTLPQTTGRSTLSYGSGKRWRRRVTLPLGPACKAGASLFCHTPIGKPSGCCPQPAEFWRLCRTAGAQLARKLKGPGAFAHSRPRPFQQRTNTSW